MPSETRRGTRREGRRGAATRGPRGWSRARASAVLAVASRRVASRVASSRTRRPVPATTLRVRSRIGDERETRRAGRTRRAGGDVDARDGASGARARRRRSRASSPRVVDRVVASRRASGRLRGGISSPSALASRPAEPGETPDERRDRVRDDAATTPRGGRGIARVVGTYRRRCVSAKRALKRDVARARPSPYAVAAKKQTRVRRVGAGETQRATRQQSNPARLLRVKKKMNRRTIPSIATTRDAPDVHL